MADLRKAVLTKPAPQKQVGADKDNQSPLENPEIWEAARKKIAAGWPQPDFTFYVVIESGTVIDTEQKLKEIAGMSSAPKTFTTVYKGLHKDIPAPGQMGKNGQPMPVKVGAVSYRELQKIKSKADCVGNLWILMQDKKTTKGAIKVVSYKKPAVAGKPAAK